MPFSIKRNILHYYRSLIKDKQFESCEYSLHNIIRTMKFSRHLYVCGEDFSTLDWGNVPLNDLYFSDNGEYPSSFDNTKINEYNFVTGHLSPITSVAYSLDGKNIITASYDSIIIWDTITGLLKHELITNYEVVAAKFISNNKCMIGLVSGKIIILDTDSNKIINELSEYESYFTPFYFSPDGNFCLTIFEVKSGFGKEIDSNYIFWNIKTGSIIYKFKLDTCCHPIVSSNNKLVLVPQSNTAIIYDMENKKIICKLKGHQPEDENNIFYHGTIISATFSPDGKKCLTGSQDNTAIIWNAENGQPIHILKNHTDFISAVAFSPDGKKCLTGSLDNTATIWNVENGQPIHINEHTGAINSVSFSTDGFTCLTGSSDKTAILWNVENGNIIRKFKSYINSTTEAIFSKDKTKAIMGSKNGIITFWNMAEQKLICKLSKHKCRINSLAFSKDGLIFLSGSSDKTAIIWSAFNQKIIKILNNQSSAITAVAISSNSKKFLTGSIYGEITLWNINGDIIYKFKYEDGLHPFKYDKEIYRLSFSTDDKFFSVEYVGGETIFFDIESHNKIESYDFEENCLYEETMELYPELNLEIKSLYEIMENLNFNNNFDENFDIIGYTIINKNIKLYNITNIYIQNCSFKNITADEKTKEIIRQQGGILGSE